MVYSTVKGDIIFDTYKKLEDLLLLEGSKFDSERKEVIELLNVRAIVRYPYIRGKHNYWNGDKLEDYINEFFELNNKGFVYTYGDRILKYRSVCKDCKLLKLRNQLNIVIDKLKRTSNTRRAVMVIYDPLIDSDKEDVPCLQHIQYQVRSNTLITTVLYRSHDIDAWYPNVCGLAELSKYIAKKCGLFMGEMVIYSNNLHKYTSELPKR